MDLLTKLAAAAAGFVVFGFAAIVVGQMVMGRISLAGLLASKEPGGAGTFSPARLQLLIFTIVVAARYLHAVLVNPDQASLPALPQGVVAALGGSQVVYLGGKALATFFQPQAKDPE